MTAGARFRWINNKSVQHSSSVFACHWGKNTCAPSIVYRLLIGWNCHTTWSQGNLHYMRLHFLKLDREFFCLQPSLARLYSAAASPSERLRSDGSLAKTELNRFLIIYSKYLFEIHKILASALNFFKTFAGSLAMWRRIKQMPDNKKVRSLLCPL